MHPDATQVFSHQGSNKRKEVSIDNINVEVLPVKGCAKYLGQTITFEQQETTEMKSRVRAHWASIYQVQTPVHIEIIAPWSQTSIIQHGHYTNADVRLWNMDTLTRTWKLDPIDATPRCLLRLIIQTKRIYKKVMKNNEEKETKNDEEPTNEENDTENSDCHQNFEGETEEGNSSNTDCDQDNEVSSWMTPMKTSKQQKLKKRTGSNH